MRWHVGGIGFQHDGVQWQTGDQATQLQRPVISQSTAKTQLEPQIDEALRLLRAAVEGVRNAVPVGTRHVAQPLEHLIDRAAHMQ